MNYAFKKEKNNNSLVPRVWNEGPCNMWLCVFVFYVSHLDIRPHQSSRLKANPQDMREHERKSNYIKRAILLPSFVIVIVAMISAEKKSSQN